MIFTGNTASSSRVKSVQKAGKGTSAASKRKNAVAKKPAATDEGTE